jgi:glycosyltransferase involved in cell wall biosynthesis
LRAVPELSIIMPTFNEGRTLEEAVRGVLNTEVPVRDIELLVVDDGSTDGTREVLANGTWPENMRVITHESNHGKGAAIRTGLAHARGTWSVIMDADLEYESADLAKVVEPLVDGEAEVVFGTRAFRGHTAFNFWYVVGNRFVTLIANVLYNTWLSDMMTCQKGMSTDLFRSLDLREDGFAVEPEIAARVLRRGISVYEVPVDYRARRREEGKKLSAVDGLRVLRTLVRCRLTSAPRPAKPVP